MNAESLELLEYERLRSLVARYVASEAGRRLLATVEPRQDRQVLLTELAEAAEAITYLKDAAKPQTRAGDAPGRLRFEGLPDVDEACARLRIEGAVLEPLEINSIATVLERATMKPVLVLVLTALVTGACATPEGDGKQAAQPVGDRQCFWASQVNSFQAVDDAHINIRVGAGDVYALTLFGPCHDIDWANRMTLVSRGGSLICDGHDAEILAPTTRGQLTCAVQTVRRLTPAEVAALPAKAKP